MQNLGVGYTLEGVNGTSKEKRTGGGACVKPKSSRVTRAGKNPSRWGRG